MEMITKGDLHFKFGFEGVSNECKDLLTKLLVKEPEKRMKILEALKHPWFEKFDPS